MNKLQQWDHWLRHSLGRDVLDAERHFLPSFLANCYGKYALLIGVPEQHSLLKFSAIPQQILVSRFINKQKPISYIESDLLDLPIASASVDLVVLPHILEHANEPQQLLSEACRVVKPEGYIIILGFNPYSLWGLKKHAPWAGHFMAPHILKKQLLAAEYEIVRHERFLFRPPLEHHCKLYKNLHFLEWIGSVGWPIFGGIYVLMAQAKSIPLTPIKLAFQKPVVASPVTYPKPTTRNME